MIICPKCGKENPEVISNCKYCEARLSDMPTFEERYIASQPKSRHWFVSVLLWGGLIHSSIYVIRSLIDFFTAAGSIYDIIFSVIYLVYLYANILLLKWRKLGFYIYMSAVILLYVALAVLTSNLIMLISIPIAIVIFYVLLQISHNGIPFWKFLK